jgi:Outer membrane protein beta-barrel domain
MIRRRVRFVLMILTVALPAAAQTRERLNLFTGDARLTFPGYEQSDSVATSLGVDKLALPERGLGLVFGAHLYPLRKGVVTLGLGAELMASKRSSTIEATTTAATASTVNTRFSAFSPQISLNFGSKQGWSYISGGVGFGAFTTELASKPVPDAEGRVKVINYGGGARWFVNDHVAVSLDLRFYAVNPQDASLGRPAYPRMTIMAISAGIGLK